MTCRDTSWTLSLVERLPYYQGNQQQRTMFDVKGKYREIDWLLPVTSSWRSSFFHSRRFFFLSLFLICLSSYLHFSFFNCFSSQPLLFFSLFLFVSSFLFSFFISFLSQSLSFFFSIFLSLFFSFSLSSFLFFVNRSLSFLSFSLLFSFCVSFLSQSLSFFPRFLFHLSFFSLWFVFSFFIISSLPFLVFLFSFERIIFTSFLLSEAILYPSRLFHCSLSHRISISRSRWPCSLSLADLSWPMNKPDSAVQSFFGAEKFL